MSIFFERHISLSLFVVALSFVILASAKNAFPTWLLFLFVASTILIILATQRGFYLDTSSRFLHPDSIMRIKWDFITPILIIENCQISESTIELVNWFMHGPIPLKLELVRIEKLNLPLSLWAMLSRGSLAVDICGLQCSGRGTHEDEWDQDCYYKKCVMNRRWQADYTQALIEGTFKASYRWWGFIVDSIINNMTFTVENVHLSIKDMKNEHCFGIMARKYSCKPLKPEIGSLGATPHCTEFDELVFYVDPLNEINRSTLHFPFLKVQTGMLIIEFPEIFSTLLRRCEKMPGGRGKRLRLRGDFSGIKLTVQPNQSKTLIFSCICCFCPGKYSAWKEAIFNKSIDDCKPLSPNERKEYVEAAVSAGGMYIRTPFYENLLPFYRKKHLSRLALLESLESKMSIGEMLLLRKKWKKWKIRPISFISDGDRVCSSDDILEGCDTRSNEYQELLELARYVYALRLHAWEVGTCLREVYIEELNLHDVAVEFRRRTSASSDKYDFGSAVQAMFVAMDTKLAFRIFLSRGAKENRAFSQGAVVPQSEPEMPWIDFSVSTKNPVIVDEYTGKALRHATTSSCLIDSAFSNSNNVSTFSVHVKMWSSYVFKVTAHIMQIRMTVNPPAFRDLVAILCDAFRRRWLDGGEFPVFIPPEVPMLETSCSFIRQNSIDQENTTGRAHVRFSSEKFSEPITEDTFRDALNNLESSAIVADTLRTMRSINEIRNFDTYPSTTIEECSNAEVVTGQETRTISSQNISNGTSDFQYLALKGRKISIDVEFLDTEILLLQNPCTPWRSDGSNILALCTSGSFNLHSDSHSEMITLSINRFLLLPCTTVQPQYIPDLLWISENIDSNSVLRKSWQHQGLVHLPQQKIIEPATFAAQFDTKIYHPKVEMSIEEHRDIAALGSPIPNAHESEMIGSIREEEFEQSGMLIIYLSMSSVGISMDIVKSIAFIEVLAGGVTQRSKFGMSSTAAFCSLKKGAVQVPLQARVEIPLRCPCLVEGGTAEPDVHVNLRILDCTGNCLGICDVDYNPREYWQNIKLKWVSSKLICTSSEDCPTLLVRVEWAPSDLLINVFRCRHLIIKGGIDNESEEQVQPFVRVSIGGNTSRTKVSNNPVDPQYEEQFVFNLNPLVRSCEPGVMESAVTPQTMDISVHSVTPAEIVVAVIGRGRLSDEEIGRTSIPLKYMNKKSKEWYRLKAVGTTKETLVGEIEVEIRWVPSPAEILAAADRGESGMYTYTSHSNSNGVGLYIKSDASLAEEYPEPNMIVTRSVTMVSSDLTVKISELDSVVLMGVVKSIRMMLQHCSGSSEVNVVATQEKILSEAHGARQAQIQALRNTFQSSSDEREQHDNPELLDLHEIVESLRDFERKKALTETEISRKVDQFLSIIDDIADESEFSYAESMKVQREGSIREGFICPHCHRMLATQRALINHFKVIHGDALGEESEDKRVMITVEQFISALQCFMEEEPHAGYVAVCCEEFSSTIISNLILGRAKSLPELLAALPANDPIDDFWNIYERETGGNRYGFLGDHGVKILQIRMVRALKNYNLARDAWHYLVVPAAFDLPRAVDIRTASEKQYQMMPCAALVGQPYYLDKPQFVILSLPSILHNVLLTGIMTYRKDRAMSGNRFFLTFTLTRSAIVYVCHDSRLRKKPLWLSFFSKVPGAVVHTNECDFELWGKRHEAGVVRLGCNDGRRKGCANYFVLLARNNQEDIYNLPKISSGDGQLFTPYWLLRPQTLAGGNIALADAIGSLVEASRIKKKGKFMHQITGGMRSRESRVPTTSTIPGNICIVHMQYFVTLDSGSIAIQVVDKKSSSQSLQAQLRFWNLSARLELNHLQPDDWLGRPDTLQARLTWAGEGTRTRSTGDVLNLDSEYFLEPTQGEIIVESVKDSPATEIRLIVDRHVVINVSTGLVEMIKSLATQTAVQWQFCYDPSDFTSNLRPGGSISDDGSFFDEFRPSGLVPTAIQYAEIKNMVGIDVQVYGLVGRRNDEGFSGDIYYERNTREGFICPDCMFEFDSPQELTVHYKAHRNESAISSLFGRTDTYGWSIPELTVCSGQKMSCILPSELDTGRDKKMNLIMIKLPGFKPVSSIQVGAEGLQIYRLEIDRVQDDMMLNKSNFNDEAVRTYSDAVYSAASTQSNVNRPSKNIFGLNSLATDLSKPSLPPKSASHSTTEPKKRRQSFVFHSANQATTRGKLSNRLTPNVATHLGLVVEITKGEKSNDATALDDNNIVQIALRTNVCLLNKGKTCAEVDLGLPTPYQLLPLEEVSIPIPILMHHALRVRGDATHSWHSPIKITPALLDPATPSVLRRTPAMEMNSLHLACRSKDERKRAQTGKLTQELSPSFFEKDVESNRSSFFMAGGSACSTPKAGATPLIPSNLYPVTESLVSDWVITINPSCIITNALPCSAEFEITQPSAQITEQVEHPSGINKHNDSAPAVRDAAHDLFFLPEAIEIVGESDEAGRVHAATAILQKYDSDMLKTENYRKNTDSDRKNSELEAKHQIEVVYRGVIDAGREVQLGRISRDRPIWVRIRVASFGSLGSSWSWAIRLSPVSRCTRTAFNATPPMDIIWGSHWSENSALSPQMKLACTWSRDGPRRLIAYSDYWIINKTGVALMYKSNLLDLDNLKHRPEQFKRSEGDVSRGKKCSPVERPRLMSPTEYDENLRHSESQSIGSLGVTTLMVDATYYSDGLNQHFFGPGLCSEHDEEGKTIPIMLSCPSQKIQVMPYSLAVNAADKDLHICDLQVYSSSLKLRYWISSSLKPGDTLFSDHSAVLYSLPPDIFPIVARIVSPANESSDPENHSFLSFFVTEDCDIYVCVDCRLFPNKIPNWLHRSGFRLLPEDCRIHVNNPSISLRIFRRYVRRRTRVRLGGNAASMDFGERPRLPPLIRNYCVLFSPPRDDFPPADVRDPVLDRDLGGTLLSRGQCSILQDFQIGDCPYSDRNYEIKALPEEIVKYRLTCVQTCQTDKGASGDRLVGFTLTQSSVVFLCLDGRARAIPSWVESEGFVHMDGVQIPGLEYRLPYHYDIWSRYFDRGVVWLGGNRAPGAKRMYMVFVRASLSENGDYDCISDFKFEKTHGSVSKSTSQVSSFWNSERNGQIQQFDVNFNGSRSWSPRFSVDAVGTAGELQTSCADFGVSIKALPGLFSRTRVVTLYPRFIVRNDLAIPLQFVSVLICQRSKNDIKDASTNLSTALRSNPDLLPFLKVIPPMSSAVVYHFSFISALVSSDVNDNNPLHRALMLSIGYQSKKKTIESMKILEQFSQPVFVEHMGLLHLWMTDQDGKVFMVSATVSLQSATVYVTLSNAANTPPYRIENRSSTATLVYRQATNNSLPPGPGQESLNLMSSAKVLAPLEWHSFTWEDITCPKELWVTFQSGISSGGDSDVNTGLRWTAFRLEKIGELEPLTASDWAASAFTQALAMLGPDDEPFGWTSRNGASRGKQAIGLYRLYVEVRAEGRTRVISFGDVKRKLPGLLHTGNLTYANALSQMMRLYTCLNLHVQFTGLNLNLISNEQVTCLDSEVLSFTIDRIALTKRSCSNRIEASILHFQIDDMRPRARFPIIFHPVDSGLNTHVRIGHREGRGMIPFVHVEYERELNTLSMPHFKKFEVAIQRCHVRIDVDFLLYIVALVTRVLPEFSDSAVLDKMSRSSMTHVMHHTLSLPPKNDNSLVYIEYFRHGPIVVQLDLYVGQRFISQEALSSEDADSAGGLAMLGGNFLSTLGVLGGTLARISPTFVFDELVVIHYYGNARQFASAMIRGLAQQGIAQSYKVVGSMELLGDPLALVNKLGDSVMQFIRTTQAEFRGEEPTFGAGARMLVSGVVGGAFGSAAKITGSLEDVIRGLSGTEIEEEEETNGVRHLKHGFQKGGQLFYDSIQQGIAGLMDRPLEGAKEEGVAGFLTGVAKGLVGVVAAPVAGALGAVSKVTEGVDASTRYYQEQRMGRRREPRSSPPGCPLLVISQAMMLSNLPGKEPQRIEKNEKKT